jgi:hypothetical protein
MQMRLTKPLAPMFIGAVRSRPGTSCADNLGKSHGQGNDEGAEGTGGGCGGGERGGDGANSITHGRLHNN